MNELTMTEKEMVLRDNPELGLDDLDGALSVEVIRAHDDCEQPDRFVICKRAGEKSGTFDIRLTRFRTQCRLLR